MKELREACEASGFTPTKVGVRGTAATVKSNNPKKPGHYFDKNRFQKSDIDAFVVTDEYLDAKPNIEKFFHPEKIEEAYPKLDAWGKKWSKTLGREIRPAAFRSNAPAMSEDCIKITPP